MNNILRMAIGAAAVVAVVIIGVNLFPQGSTVGEPLLSPAPIPTESQSAASPPVEPPIVHGMPGSREGPAGEYSWTPGTRGWMHKVHSDSIGVSIEFSASANAYESGPTAVTVAGYEGTYQELPISADGIRTQRWIVDIEDRRVTITVMAYPGTTAAQLAEAHAIIESIRIGPQETGAGMRLIFTLPAGWDSG